MNALLGMATWLVFAAAAAHGQSEQGSPWYLERGHGPVTRPSATTGPTSGAPEDSVIQTARLLAGLLRDGSVPGFYDGQFAATRERFDDLASIASDPDMHHVLRVMAVMALQEAGSGEEVARVLVPLILPREIEFTIEYDAFNNGERNADDRIVRDRLTASLSQHARFALAKDGQPAAVLAKIEYMEQHIAPRMQTLLNPAIDSLKMLGVGHGRQVIFEIGYHYQQFDDYVRAEEWFRKLTDNLVGLVETRWAHYNLACIAALSGRPEDAVVELRHAYAVGFTDVAWMEEDGDLATVRDLATYKALLAEISNQPLPQPKETSP